MGRGRWAISTSRWGSLRETSAGSINSRPALSQQLLPLLGAFADVLPLMVPHLAALPHPGTGRVPPSKLLGGAEVSHDNTSCPN